MAFFVFTLPDNHVHASAVGQHGRLLIIATPEGCIAVKPLSVPDVKQWFRHLCMKVNSQKRDNSQLFLNFCVRGDGVVAFLWSANLEFLLAIWHSLSPGLMSLCGHCGLPYSRTLCNVKHILDYKLHWSNQSLLYTSEPMSYHNNCYMIDMQKCWLALYFCSSPSSFMQIRKLNFHQYTGWMFLCSCDMMNPRLRMFE